MLKANSRTVALMAGIAGVCGVAATANADGYQRRPVAAAQCCAFSWTGLYIGVNGGYAWSNDQTVHIDERTEPFGGTSAPFVSANFGSLGLAGGFAGFQAGANLQLGAVVLGFEADGQWADISDDSAATVAVASPTTPYTVTTSNKVHRFGTMRPRLGLAWDKTLVYATGGFAWGRVEHKMTFRDAGGFTALDNQSGTQVGYAVGGGLEHAFTPHLSVKVEYQYINLGSEQYAARESVGGVVTAFVIHNDTETDFHTVRVGLNYKLGAHRDPGPLK